METRSLYYILYRKRTGSRLFTNNITHAVAAW